MNGDISFGSDSDEDSVQFREESKLVEKELGLQDPVTLLEQHYAKLTKKKKVEPVKMSTSSIESENQLECVTPRTNTFTHKRSDRKSGEAGSLSQPRSSTPTRINIPRIED